MLGDDSLVARVRGEYHEVPPHEGGVKLPVLPQRAPSATAWNCRLLFTSVPKGGLLDRCATSDAKPGVQIASQSATVCKRFVFCSLESGICGGSQPTLSAALATCGLSSESYAFKRACSTAPPTRCQGRSQRRRAERVPGDCAAKRGVRHNASSIPAATTRACRAARVTPSRTFSSISQSCSGSDESQMPLRRLPGRPRGGETTSAGRCQWEGGALARRHRG